MLISLMLLQMIEIGWSYSTLIYFNVYFIQRTCVQHPIVAIYLAYVVDREIELMQEHLSQQASQRGMQVNSWTKPAQVLKLSRR
jgi:hypothetical protein